MCADGIASDISGLVAQHMDILTCPVCRGDLGAVSGQSSLICHQCRKFFGCEAGIPLLFWPNEWDAKQDVTEIVKSFYEETPFPNYEDVDSVWTLRKKADRGVFARLLDEQIPYGAKVLEVGCGTGQLSNFLGSTSGRTVFAADICLNSLKLGQQFKIENGIDNVAFLQMNLFRPIFKQESFDFVICNGVLHHTSDPRLGFKSISRLVRKGGFIIVGLYNRYGRIPTHVRRFIFKLSRGNLHWLDPRLRDKELSPVRRLTWFKDQYENPHESTHTIGEVLRWFEECGFVFVNSVPKAEAFQAFSSDEKLFESNSEGTVLDHFLVQLGMLLSRGKEGGFFVMIGRRVR